MLILTEEKWFDKYYPKEWGNWREYYNLDEYKNNSDLTGCTWLNYKSTGYVYTHNSIGLMRVNKRDENPYIRSSLFNVDTDISCSFCGAKQPDNTHWIQGIIYKKESNLELYTIKLFGVDDISYSKDFVGLYSVLVGWNTVSYVLSSWNNLKKENYYFTN